MSYQVELIENDRVLVMRFLSPMTLDDMLASSETAQQYFDAAASTIDVIMDLSDIKFFPPVTPKARQAATLKHRNAGRFILVGANKFIRVLGTIAAHVAGNDSLIFVTTREEALQIIREGSESGARTA